MWTITELEIKNLDSLSYFELASLILHSYETIIGQLSVIITVFSAYVVATYIVGRTLSWLQALSLSVIYSAYTFVSIFGLYRVVISFGDLLLYRDGEAPSAVMGTVIVCIIGWMFSIIYMLKVRREKHT